jgi:tRNA pseudouridine55 synthase
MIEPSARSPFPDLDFAGGEILNVDKPEGWTSFDVVKKIRKLIGIRKVGHAGTLDPFATGVLLVCTGRATKKVEDLMANEKEYIAVLELGKSTDTYDKTGQVTSEQDASRVTPDDIISVCNMYRGTIKQTPPMYSALKIDGERLYKKDRRGEVVARKAREIHIYELSIENIAIPLVEIKVVCSRGTYIRTLAHDIGQNLGCGAYLKALTRTRIGSYHIENAWNICSSSPEKLNGSL